MLNDAEQHLKRHAGDASADAMLQGLSFEPDLLGLPSELFARFENEGWENGVAMLLTDCSLPPKSTCDKAFAFLRTGFQSLTQACESWSDIRKEEKLNETQLAYMKLSVCLNALGNLLDKQPGEVLIRKIDAVDAEFKLTNKLAETTSVKDLRRTAKLLIEQNEKNFEQYHVLVQKAIHTRELISDMDSNPMNDAPHGTIFVSFLDLCSLACSLAGLTAQPGNVMVEVKALPGGGFQKTATHPATNQTVTYLQAVTQFMSLSSKAKDHPTRSSMQVVDLATKFCIASPFFTMVREVHCCGQAANIVNAFTNSLYYSFIKPICNGAVDSLIMNVKNANMMDALLLVVDFGAHGKAAASLLNDFLKDAENVQKRLMSTGDANAVRRYSRTEPNCVAKCPWAHAATLGP